jgi:predicted nuclease of predicted toxin-antitoxin system
VKVVADESVDKQIVDRLRVNGHDVLYIAELDPGVDDEIVLSRSRQENAILLTADKDFGELVFRQHLLHSGVLLIRLAGLNQTSRPIWSQRRSMKHGEELTTGFAVLSRRALRLRRQPR